MPEGRREFPAGPFSFLRMVPDPHPDPLQPLPPPRRYGSPFTPMRASSASGLAADPRIVRVLGKGTLIFWNILPHEAAVEHKTDTRNCVWVAIPQRIIFRRRV